MGEGFAAGYAMEVEPWRKDATVAVGGRASAWVLQITDREGCARKLLEPDGAGRVLHEYFAPDASGSVYQDAARLPHFKLAAQAMDQHSVKFDLLRRQAESRMQSGGAATEAFAVVPCLRNASLCRADKSLVPTSARGNAGVMATA